MDISYIAGFLDADGSIIIRWKRDRSRARRVVEIEISNTHKETLDLIQEFFGCGSVIRKASSSWSRKKQWKWVVGAQDQVLVILAELAPYLIQKRKIASLA